MGLNTESVVASAVELVDEDGFKTLSLSALAVTLGIRVPSLYKHIDGIDDLKQRIALQAKLELYNKLEAAAANHYGVDAFRALAAAYRDYAMEFPGRFAAAGYKALLATSSLAGSFERIAWECGVPQEASLSVVQAIRASLRGLLTLQSDSNEDLTGTVYETLVDVLVGGLENYSTKSIQSEPASELVAAGEVGS